MALVLIGVVAPTPALAAEEPIAAYSFNEDEGEVAHDSVNSHDGSVEGASWVTGKYGPALKFNANQENVVTVPSDVELELTEAFTLEAWVRPATFGSFAPVITKEAWGYPGYALEAAGEEGGVPEGRVTTELEEQETVEGSEALTPSSWSYLTLTYDGEQLRLYANGELVNALPASDPLAGKGELTLGGAETFPLEGFFDGKIDEVRLYDRALDLEEIEVDMATPIEGTEGSEIPGEPVCENFGATVVLEQTRHLSLPCEGPELTYEIASEPEHGSLSAFNAAAGTVDYAFEPSFAGADSFTFRAENGVGKSALATASIEECGAPEVEASGELTEPETPGVDLSVAASEGEPYCYIGEEEAYIKVVRVYVDEELVYTAEPLSNFSRGIQLAPGKVIGSHAFRIEAEDQFGDRAEPLEWKETTPAEGTIASIPPEAEDLKGSKGCETPKKRSSKYAIRNGVLYGTDCADIIPAHRGVKTYRGGAGNDTIRGAGNTEHFLGGEGEDTIFAGRGSDFVKGQGDNDRLNGGSGDDHIIGGGGDDTLVGGPGTDVIKGNGGDDVVRGGATTDELFGGGGTNTLSYADGATPGFEADPETGSANPQTDLVEGFPGKHGERGVYVNLSGSPAMISDDGATARYGGGSDKVEDFQNVIGTPYADLIVGSGEANVIDAGAGTDIVRGGGKDDHIYGGADSDYLDGEGEQEADTVNGGAGNDTCLSGGKEATCESSNPEGGLEPPPTGSISVGLLEPDDPGFSYADIYVRGSGSNDSITATYSAEEVTLTAFGKGTGRFDTSNNEVSGCTVSETVAHCPIGGVDSIVLNGDGGDDVLSAYSFPTGMSVALQGGSGSDVLNSGGTSEDVLVDGQGEGGDRLRGNGSDDALFANGGHDGLFAGPGNDLFISSTLCDEDKIKGGGGSDNANWAQLVGAEIEPENPTFPSWHGWPYDDPEHGVHATLGKGGGEGHVDRAGKACSKEGKIFGVESLEGSRAGDVLVGNEGNNTVLGRSGADVLKGEAGDDHLLSNNRHDKTHKDPDEEIDCGPEEDRLKKDPEDNGHIKNCEHQKVTKGANFLSAGIESEPAGEEELPPLDEAAIGAAGIPDAAEPDAFYRFDESSGTAAANSMYDEGETAGSYENGTTLGEPGFLSEGESEAVHLDGENDYVDLTSNWNPWSFDYHSCLVPLNGYSVEMWVNFDSGASGREALFSRSEEGYGLYIYRSADGRLNLTWGEESEPPTVSTYEPVGSGEWHHVVASLGFYFHCTGFPPVPEVPPWIILYVDGFAYATSFEWGSVPLPYVPTADNLVGASRDAKESLGNFMKGEMDDVAIFGESLSEEEVEAHFAISEITPPSTILMPPAETEDADEDGVPDGADNCSEVANAEQADGDLDGVGDACQEEPDTDSDGVPDEADNCPETANAEQTDTDENGVGDACPEEE